mmetsp:Transcript_19790/g.24445  ORF Transcript_19790/g.24445 Transcript_19790/m.24445 type:complete len:145 (-) Transcript_19790:2417-2851(-)
MNTKDKGSKIEDPQELARKLEELDAQQKRYAMVNEANKEEIYRINFNKVVRKQLMEPKKKGDDVDRAARFNLLGKSTDRGGDDSDPNISKLSDESGSSDGGSSVFMSEGSDDKDQKKKSGAGGKGAKPSELMSGRDHSTKKGAP